MRCVRECCKDKKFVDKDHYTLLHVSLFETPCKCCGSEHTLLNRTPDKEGYMQANLQCKIISHKTIQAMLSHQQLNREFWPCPFSLAREAGYNEDKTEAAVEQVSNQGAGKWMKESERRSFRYDALNSCFAHRIGKPPEMEGKEKLVVPITGQRPKSGKCKHRR